MKYRYSQIINALNWLTVFIIMIIMILSVYYFFSKDLALLRKNTIMSFALYFAMVIGYNKEYRERYMELKNDYAVINSFRIARKVRSFNINYEDIISIDTKSLPVIGVYAFIIKAKNIPWKIRITWRMCKFKELAAILYKKTAATNETEYIDIKFKEMAEKFYEK